MFGLLAAATRTEWYPLQICQMVGNCRKRLQRDSFGSEDKELLDPQGAKAQVARNKGLVVLTPKGCLDEGGGSRPCKHPH